MKVMTVVGTRPEIIKLSRVIPELDKHFEHVLVNTYQNYDTNLNAKFFQELGIRSPDFTFDDLPAKASGGPYVVAQIMSRMAFMMKEHEPDAVLILGDTNSCIATVYAAKRAHVPVFHMEAGNRCFDQRTPEEINRKVVDHLSDINLVYTEHARRNLEREGIPCSTIFKTGSPMREVINHYASKIAASKILETLKLNRQGYALVSLHREETVNERWPWADFLRSLRHLAVEYGGNKILFSVHPRTRKAIEEHFGPPLSIPGFDTNAARQLFEPNVILHDPVGFIDYACLQRNAHCVFSDSGTLTEEAAMLQFPAVMLRRWHERPEGMDEGTAVMCSMKEQRSMIDAQQMAVFQTEGRTPEDYTAEDVARKVARTILSYTDFVNRTVWHR